MKIRGEEAVLGVSRVLKEKELRISNKFEKVLVIFSLFKN